MNNARFIVWGGCHVAGYLLQPTQAFSALLGGKVVAQVDTLQFVKVPKHLQAVEALRPSHIVLQLGNYEFSASLRLIIKQYRQALGMRACATKAGDAELATYPTSAARPLLTSPRYGRVAGLGLLISGLWISSALHRRAFREVNACVQQHPATQFIFLSPLPHLDPAVNSLRRLGGWLLRHRIKRTTNCHWLDSHQFLPREPTLFVDQGHLNARGHRLLAEGVRAACQGKVHTYRGELSLRRTNFTARLAAVSSRLSTLLT